MIRVGVICLVNDCDYECVISEEEFYNLRLFRVYLDHHTEDTDEGKLDIRVII